MFVGLHALLAARTDTPELEIEEVEGAQFLASCQKVMRHYSVETTQKTLDFMALFGTASAMYGPRIAAIHFRKMAEKEGKAGGGMNNSNVHPFGPVAVELNERN